jgi:tRNA-2-methylthio-N6-dimethylallyladenosine synthase
MRRGHTRADYLEKIDRIKGSTRQLALTSDVIVGFPGETDEDFQETLSLVKECDYDSLYLFKYSKRRGTPAADFADTVPESEKTARFLELEKVHRQAQAEVYRAYIGRTLSVLVERKSSRSESDLMGHSTCHKVVNFAGPASLEGEIVDVVITEAKRNSLFGKLVDRRGQQ